MSDTTRASEGDQALIRLLRGRGIQEDALERLAAGRGGVFRPESSEEWLAWIKWPWPTDDLIRLVLESDPPSPTSMFCARIALCQGSVLACKNCEALESKMESMVLCPAPVETKEDYERQCEALLILMALGTRRSCLVPKLLETHLYPVKVPEQRGRGTSLVSYWFDSTRQDRGTIQGLSLILAACIGLSDLSSLESDKYWNLPILFDHICHRLEEPEMTWALYKLMLENERFASYASARTDVQTLSVVTMRLLYTGASKGPVKHLQALALVTLYAERDYVTLLHSEEISPQLWVQENLPPSISLGTLILWCLIRELHKTRDALAYSITISALTNACQSLRHVDPTCCQKLVSLILSHGGNKKLPQELLWPIGFNVLRSMDTDMAGNVDLVHAVLYCQESFARISAKNTESEMMVRVCRWISEFSAAVKSSIVERFSKRDEEEEDDDDMTWRGKLEMIAKGWNPRFPWEKAPAKIAYNVIARSDHGEDSFTECILAKIGEADRYRHLGPLTRGAALGLAQNVLKEA